VLVEKTITIKLQLKKNDQRSAAEAVAKALQYTKLFARKLFR
jgi:surface antigen